MPPAQRVLVTGTSRAGTTWIGRTLAHAEPLVYLHEPFNRDTPIRRGGLRPPYQFFMPTGWRARFLAPRVGGLVGLTRSRRWLPGSLGERWAPLFKDPLAAMAAGWLADTYGFRVVVVLRHPAATAASRQRLAWRFDFRHLLDQPRLVDGWLAPLEPRLRTAVRESWSGAKDSALLWRSVYDALTAQLRTHPDWVVVRHEDLCDDPLAGFERLYRALGLPWDGQVASRIRDDTGGHQPAEAPPATIHHLKRDSRSVTTLWRERWSPSDLEAIREITEPTSSLYYGEESWRPD